MDATSPPPTCSSGGYRFCSGSCKIEHPLSAFDGNKKTCRVALERVREWRERNMCPHGKERHRCTDCMSLDEIMKSPAFCNTCPTRLSPARVVGGTIGTGLCASCDTRKPPRIEHVVREWLLENGAPPASAMDNVHLGGSKERCGSKESVRRPDLVWVGMDRVVIIEVDENSHYDREISCDLAKTDAQTGSIQLRHKLPCIHVRWSPNGGSYHAKRQTLLGLLLRLLNCPSLPLCPVRSNVIFSCYEAKGQKHIDAVKAAANMNLIEKL